MRIDRIVALVYVVLAALFLVITGPATAQDWPQQTVTIVVPIPAGGAADAAARILADGLAKKWQRPVIIENKPGAEMTIGAAAFAAANDRHTLFYAPFGIVTLAPLTFDKLPYDTDTDLVPLVPVASIVVAVSTTGTLPINTLAELEAAIRARPGQLAWASAPTLPRYVFTAFLKQRGLDMTYVPYRDASQPQADLGEGRIHALITSVAASRSVVAAGKARFLAITETRRTAVLPDVPSASEVGYDEFSFVGGAGLFGWKGIPDALRDRIVSDVNAVLSDPAAADKLTASGQQVIGGGPAQLTALLLQQRARVLDISRAIDIKALR
jgi:tripartite-type tricarboxylate transporter receptor subunit TctC